MWYFYAVKCLQYLETTLRLLITVRIVTFTEPSVLIVNEGWRQPSVTLLLFLTVVGLHAFMSTFSREVDMHMSVIYILLS